MLFRSSYYLESLCDATSFAHLDRGAVLLRPLKPQSGRMGTFDRVKVGLCGTFTELSRSISCAVCTVGSLQA